jgi:tripartite-type tricarboxylate transporter receptor subunit TctC
MCRACQPLWSEQNMQTFPPGRPDSRRRRLLAAGATLPLVGFPALARADDAWPSRTIRIVVAGTAGTAFDLVSRVVAEILSKKYKQTVLVENRPGASTMIGMMHAAKQPADGYTLVATGLAPVVLRPAVTKNLPVDVDKAFAPVAQLVEQASALVVRADFPAQTAQDLIRMAKAKPGELKIGTNDLGSSPHMCYELFAQRTGTKWLHAPFLNPGQVLNGLMSSTTDAGFTQLPPVLELVKAGRIRALAVTTSQRDPKAPNVPTLQEAGLEGFEVSSWLSMHTIAGTPQPIVDRLSRDIIEGMNTPEVRERLEKAGFVVATLPAREFGLKVRRERAEWEQTAKVAGIQLDFKKD